MRDGVFPGGLTDEVTVTSPANIREHTGSDGGRAEMVSGLIAVFWSCCLSSGWVSVTLHQT